MKNDTDTPHACYSDLLARLNDEHFSSVISCSPRQAKESYFARLGIRAPKTSTLSLPGAKNQARMAALRAFFVRDKDDALAEEILRRFLLAHRPMLRAALDHLEIPHEDGLTESADLLRLGELRGPKRAELVDVLQHKAAVSRQDAELYLDFMALERANA